MVDPLGSTRFPSSRVGNIEVRIDGHRVEVAQKFLDGCLDPSSAAGDWSCVREANGTVVLKGICQRLTTGPYGISWRISQSGKVTLAYEALS